MLIFCWNCLPVVSHGLFRSKSCYFLVLFNSLISHCWFYIFSSQHIIRELIYLAITRTYSSLTIGSPRYQGIGFIGEWTLPRIYITSRVVNPSRANKSKDTMDTLMSLYRLKHTSPNNPSTGKQRRVSPCNSKINEFTDDVLAWKNIESAVRDKWIKKHQKITTFAPKKTMTDYW